VSPSKEVRDASSTAEKHLNEYLIEASMREDVFEAVNAFWESQKSGELSTDATEAERDPADQLGAESARLVERMLRDFQRAGLGLPLAQREAVKTIKKRLSELSIEFQKNLNEDISAVLLTRAELTGMPDDFVEGLDKEGDLFKVTMKVWIGFAV
jgi:Zn-dependent oligopeptidase